jgi:hypothetical protein
VALKIKPLLVITWVLFVELVVLHEQFHVETLVVRFVWLTHEQLERQVVTLTKVTVGVTGTVTLVTTVVFEQHE